jgi:hypothetical protein
VAAPPVGAAASCTRATGSSFTAALARTISSWLASKVQPSSRPRIHGQGLAGVGGGGEHHGGVEGVAICRPGRWRRRVAGEHRDDEAPGLVDDDHAGVGFLGQVGATSRTIAPSDTMATMPSKLENRMGICSAVLPA